MRRIILIPALLLAAALCACGGGTTEGPAEPETAEAVKTIVPELTNAGYRLVTVSELAQVKGVTMQPGVAYGSFTS